MQAPQQASHRFDGHTALVTGAGRGIGAATAHRLAAEGARVLVTDADAARAGRTAARLRADGLTAEAYACDVGDRAAVEAAVARAVERFGGLDVLVNNAYSFHADPPLVEDVTDDAWSRDLDITLTGAFRCVRAALPHLAAAPDGRGAVVSVGSVNGEQDYGAHAYSAAKAGLAGLTRTLAGQCASRGVRVNLVAPGTVRTPGWDGREDALERAAGQYPLGRVGEPEDIAAAVAFLASRDAAWITGVTLPVDGGILIGNTGLKEILRRR
ncbi:SDR family NAD(P)-dependent oxidoreductase [Streptomyces sp. VNUA116]|uniref:SDR family NAD(P)-dependent oxidoreductase n=1 Tax=Streptomyces sp. VNUA116 TaxID=3062449 RepID=UPI0026750AFC|nr:SDR family NAD(P)-dependent oxidoreductase [Streptomyces sp. VNUA116]WKU45256.1 SDR family NAD(P)-dependent oxidoreductase [Streptomyces sp. VNUA116]